MYGGLDVADAIRLGTIARPGIPTTLRTLRSAESNSISRSTAGPRPIPTAAIRRKRIFPEMWSMDFWRELFDEMARQRFNMLSLWNWHLFRPS